MLGSCLVQERFGVSLAKTDVLINIILVCYQAMKESKLSWPLITEDDQDRQLTRYTALVKFAEDLKGQLREQSITGYLEAHPEKELFAYVNSELVGWLKSVVPEQSDKYVMLAAMNIVNCIAYVPMPELNNEYERDL
ncbi:MAG: hypothetical protein IT392_12130 [Nitrospirae bacterium]|nr:hypothetical protein [Nitrospirota bacterium]